MATVHSEFIDFLTEFHNLGTFVSKFRSLTNHFLSLFKNLFDGGRTGLDFIHKVLGGGS